MKNLHIGICDDEQPIRSYLRTLVKSQVADCTVTEYSSGEEFLQDQREHGYRIHGYCIKGYGRYGSGETAP